MNKSCCQNRDWTKEIDVYIDELSRQGDVEGKLIAVMHRAQEIVGFLPADVQAHIAGRLSIPAAKVFGVATFYSYFSMAPKGKYSIDVCMGTACFVGGAEKVLDEFRKILGVDAGQTTDDLLFTLGTLRCVGECSLAPVVTINGKMYGGVSPEQVAGIIDEYKRGGVE